MNIIFLRSHLPKEEIHLLREEFPQYEFFTQKDLDISPLSLLKTKYWDYIEILYDDKLSPQELAKAHQLRWLHTPSSRLDQVCLSEILARKNILISKTPEPNVTQISEFVMSGILAFAKQLFHWHQRTSTSNKNNISLPDKKDPWLIENRLLLQIGLGTVGSGVAKKAYRASLKVWGVSQPRSFHPYCHKTFSPKELHSILPVADIVSLCLPKDQSFSNWFKQPQLELMKKDSILIVIAPSKVVDEEALEAVAKTGKFRGILLDLPHQSSIFKNSTLKDMPNVLITPQIAAIPLSNKRQSFLSFRHNLRQYTHGNFNNMNNLIGTKPLYSIS